jgi:hypothetical protein
MELSEQPFAVNNVVQFGLYALRHRHARCDLSYDHLGWTIRTWRRVHWSDESRFCYASLGVILWGLPAHGQSVTFPRLTKMLHQSYNDGMVNSEVICHPSMAKTTDMHANRLPCLLTCETCYWSIFIYVYMTGCAKCHVYFSTFVFANENY